MTNSFGLFGLMGSLTLSLSLAGCHPGVDGNGERVDEVRETATFTRVRSNCELDVQLVQGEQPSLTVSLDSNLQDLVETRVVNGTLIIDLEDNVGEIVDGPHVLITVPELTAAKLDGSGRMTLAFDEPELPLDLFLSGSGDLRFSGKTAAIGAYLSGSGDLRLEGETSDADLKLSGSGAIHGKGLTASSASIALSGSGDISATVQDSASVSLSGSGQIDLFGTASVDVSRTTGSGDIVQH